MNPFQCDFDYRLREWKNLRLIIRGEKLDLACVHVDNWWQQAPLINHHLHWADSNSWPDPWTILNENIYCTLTRAIGMCYTLLLSDIVDTKLIIGVDQNCEEHNLVIVGHAKYILNYWPNSVLSTNLNDFTIVREISLDNIKNQIR